MPVKVPPLKLYFEAVFLEHYAALEAKSRRTVDKAVRLIAANPRHSSLNTHKAKNTRRNILLGALTSLLPMRQKILELPSNTGPKPGMIAIRNCGHHDTCERSM